MTVDPAQILPLLYAAAGDTEQWPLFLDALATQTNAAMAALISRDEQGAGCTLVIQHGADPEAERLYQAHYWKLDTSYVYVQQHGFKRSGAIVPAQAYIADQDLLRTEYCNDFMLKFGIFHHCFCLFGRNGIPITKLSLMRGRQHKPFAEPELRVLRFLAPHIERAIALFEKYRQLKLESEAKQHALDQMPSGVIFVDADGRVIGKNAAAEAIIERQNGLTIREGRLRARHSSDDKRLQSALARSCRIGAHHTQTHNWINNAGLLVGGTQVSIGPATASAGGTGPGSAAVVFVNDGNQPRPQSQLLHDIYGLTPAESRLALLLADGRSGLEAAQLLGVTRNTLKTQMQSIFGKTNVRRQAQLARLLASLPAQSQHQSLY